MRRGQAQNKPGLLPAARWRTFGAVDDVPESSYSAVDQFGILCEIGSGLLGSPRFEVGQSSKVHS